MTATQPKPDYKVRFAGWRLGNVLRTLSVPMWFALLVVAPSVAADTSKAATIVEFATTVVGGTSAPQSIQIVNTSGLAISVQLRIWHTSCPIGGVPSPPCGTAQSEETSSFRVLTACGQLAVAQGCDLQVVFVPTIARRVHATLEATFVGNGGNIGTLGTFDLFGIGTPGQLVPGTALAIESYHAGLDHYFVTDRADEQALLDNGTIAGWVRTGYSFWVWPTTGPMPPGTSSVCRFYGRPGAGINSHFYSASPAECDAVVQKFSYAWILESPNFFYAYLPNIDDGTCPPGATPVYRLYNGKSDAGHRYIPARDLTYLKMLLAQWLPEGYGQYGVAMCGAPGVFTAPAH